MKVVVVGAGGFGRHVCDVLEKVIASGSTDLELFGILDDAPSDVNLGRVQARRISYLGTVDDFIAQNQPNGYRFVIGVNSPAAKKSISEKFDSAGFTAITLVHPDAGVGSEVTLRPGAVVCSGARLSTNISLGSHAHINFNSTVGHDTHIGDFVSINPLASISGNVVLGHSVTIGAAAFVLQGISIGENAVVGASACVTREVAPHSTVVGVPARAIRSQ
jgi:sugar O-acyltransferase (sialic acid O-acetyltransferase NeuD family)